MCLKLARSARCEESTVTPVQGKFILVKRQLCVNSIVDCDNGVNEIEQTHIVHKDDSGA